VSHTFPIAVEGSVTVDDVQASFETFFEAERGRLFRALLLITRNAGEAEELLQDAFVRVWERWDTVRGVENPAGYLYRTALNVYRNGLRRAKVAARRAIRPSPPDDPFAAVEARDETVRALARLTPRQRTAAVLTQLLDYSYDEAAATMRVRPSTVRALVSQARAALSETREHVDE
jgi:RNA polymerase sigma-70 factor (ECF subfamily)